MHQTNKRTHDTYGVPVDGLAWQQFSQSRRSRLGGKECSFHAEVNA